MIDIIRFSEIVLVAIVLLAYLLLTDIHGVFAGAPPGLNAAQYIATSSVVGPQSIKTLVVAANCTSRLIGTKSEPIMVMFDDPSNGDLSSTTFSGLIGYWQGASTTVVYDAGLYGCGRLMARAAASTTITFSSFK